VTRAAATSGGRSLAVLRCATALVAVASAALHLVAAASSADDSLTHRLVLVGMAMACLPCAVHLVLLPSRRVWVQTAAVSAAMLAIHPLLVLGTGAAHHGSLHAGSGWAVLPAAMIAVPLVAALLAVTGLLRSSPRGVPSLR
jgi:hypothetical protein